MFKCQKCGCCCKFFKCPILTAENLCPIYENRPNICKVVDNNNNNKMQITKQILIKIKAKIFSVFADKNNGG